MTLHNSSPPQVSIGIPVYGASRKLFFALQACLASSSTNYSIRTIYIVNSGPSFDLPACYSINNSNIAFVVKDVPHNYFWSRSVACIYALFKNDASSHLLLLNHDCYPSISCFDTLVGAHKRLGDNSVCHSVLIDHVTSEVWWSGTYLPPLSRQRFIVSKSDCLDSDTPPISTSSTMGQCLLIPDAAVNISFLHCNHLPHYFADSVQTSEMRRNGFNLYVIPQSVAFVDQSDQLDKVQWLSTRSLNDLSKVFFHPKSSRNIKAVFYSTLFHRDSFFAGIICAIYEVLGKILITLIELVANVSNIPVIRNFTTLKRLG